MKRTTMKRTLALVTIVGSSILAARPAAAVPFQVTGSTTEGRAGLVRTVETVQAGPNPIDRFEVVHVRHPGDSNRRAVLLAPPLGTGFQFYEISDTGRYEDSIAALLATRGFDVWGFSQRVQGLPAGTCESGAADCSVIAGWGLAQLAGDAEYVRTRIVAEAPDARIVVGGMSLGGMIGIASVNAHPEAYAGAIVIDAGLYSRDPVSIGLARSGCDALTGAVAAGFSWSGEQIGVLKLVNSLAEANPTGASPLIPGMTNAQAWVTVLSVPTPGPTSLTPDFIFDAGDPATGTLTFADPAFLHRDFDGFVDYLTFAEVRDVDCSVAGDRTFTGNLAAFTGPVFAVSDGRGFGAIVDDTMSLMPGADVTLLSYPAFGHQDVVFTTDHREKLERPLVQWLETRAF